MILVDHSPLAIHCHLPIIQHHPHLTKQHSFFLTAWYHFLPTKQCRPLSTTQCHPHLVIQEWHHPFLFRHLHLHHGPLDYNIMAMFTLPLPTLPKSLVGLSGRSYFIFESLLSARSVNFCPSTVCLLINNIIIGIGQASNKSMPWWNCMVDGLGKTTSHLFVLFRISRTTGYSGR